MSFWCTSLTVLFRNPCNVSDEQLARDGELDRPLLTHSPRSGDFMARRMTQLTFVQTSINRSADTSIYCEFEDLGEKWTDERNIGNSSINTQKMTNQATCLIKSFVSSSEKTVMYSVAWKNRVYIGTWMSAGHAPCSLVAGPTHDDDWAHRN